MTQSKNWWEFLRAMAESWKKLKASNVFSLYILLNNNSLFVSQLHEDKSLMLQFSLLYYWPPNSELLLNNSLLELIYFLSKIRADGHRLP